MLPFKIFQTAPPISPFFPLNERFFFKQEAEAPTPPPQARFGRPAAPTDLPHPRPQLIFPVDVEAKRAVEVRWPSGFIAEEEAVEADSSVLRAEELGALRIRRPSRPGICSQDREQGSKSYYDTTAGRMAARTSTSSPATVSNDSSSTRYTPSFRLPAPPRSSPLCSRRVRVPDLCALRRSFRDPRRRVPRSPGHWCRPCSTRLCLLSAAHW